MQPEVVATAKWWANQLRQLPIMDNGSSKLAKDLEHFEATGMLTKLEPIPEEQIHLFEDSVAYLLQIKFDQCDEGVWLTPKTVVVSVDYVPDELLEHASFIALLRLDRRLPIKTSTITQTGKAWASVGYSDRIEHIYGEFEQCKLKNT